MFKPRLVAGLELHERTTGSDLLIVFLGVFSVVCVRLVGGLCGFVSGFCSSIRGLSFVSFRCFCGGFLRGFAILGGSFGNTFGFSNYSLFWRDGFHYKFDDGHWGVVAGPVTDLGDAGVAAFALCHSWADDGEQFVHNRLVGARVASDQTLHFTTCAQVALLGVAHQTFCIWLQALGLGQRSLNGLVLEQAHRQVGQHTTLVCRTAAQARSFCWGRHEFSLYDLAALTAKNQWFKYD